MTTSDRGALPAQSVMTGAGYYNTHSEMQAATAGLAEKALCDAARGVSLAEANVPIVVVDYGCSEGRNSLEPMHAVIAILRERAAERSILMVHTDQVGNDFTSLFGLLRGFATKLFEGSSNLRLCCRAKLRRAVAAERLRQSWLERACCPLAQPCAAGVRDVLLVAVAYGTGRAGNDRAGGERLAHFLVTPRE